MTAPFLVETWRRKHQYCADDIPPASHREASWVIKDHSSHGPQCKQYWASSAYLSEASNEFV
jgi:hypothetical protein